MSLQVFSPAKINLFLRVLDEREDGYHNIASLFQAIDLGDTISFALDEIDSLSCDNSDIPTNSSNLVFRAINLFREKTDLDFKIKVVLQKRIPHEAGLGGGSSNAASTLWALNELFDRPATLKELATWSAGLGSDVPFFFSKGTAYCTGRGEVVIPLPPLQGNVEVFKPHYALSTKMMYQKLGSKRSRFTSQQLLAAHVRGRTQCVNDFEQIAFSLLPELKVLKKRLLETGYKEVSLTGSGTALFCLGNGKPISLAGVEHFLASFLHRKGASWYNTSNEGVAYENV